MAFRTKSSLDADYEFTVTVAIGEEICCDFPLFCQDFLPTGWILITTRAALM